MSTSTLERLELIIPGEPVPNARARRGPNGYYTPKRTTEYRQRVQTAWMLAGRPTLGTAPFSLSALFYRSSRRAADLDNLTKGILDALNRLAWADDAQLVCISGAHKLQCAKGDERTKLTAWTVQR